jgi:hypothetical protein
MRELTKIQIFANGKTVPYIEPGTAIIKIEDGLVAAGKLNYDLKIDWSLHIEYPKNEIELNQAAKEIIRKFNPEYLKSKDAVIIVCPKELESKMKW